MRILLYLVFDFRSVVQLWLLSSIVCAVSKLSFYILSTTVRLLPVGLRLRLLVRISSWVVRTYNNWILLVRSDSQLGCHSSGI